MLFTRAALRTKSNGLPIDIHYIYLMLFTHAVPRTKSKGLSIDVPYIYLILFYMCNAAYKDQGAPD
jgi:hypothetical protein